MNRQIRAAIAISAFLALGMVAILFYSLHRVHPPSSYSSGSILAAMVLSNTSYLNLGDVFTVKIIGMGESGFSVRIEPSSLFTVVERRSTEKAVEFIVSVKETKVQGLASGRVLVSRGETLLLEVPFYAVIGLSQPTIYSNGAILEVRGENGSLRVWIWEVGIPYKLSSRPFFAPKLEGFMLLQDYLNLQLYVSSVTLRQGVWWPLRGLGPQNFQKELEDVILVKPADDYIIVNVTEIPLSAKGSSIAISGTASIKETLEGRKILKLTLGFLDKPHIYVIVPEKLSVVSASAAGEELAFSTCIYAPPGYRCYQIDVPKAILSPFDLEIIFSKA